MDQEKDKIENPEEEKVEVPLSALTELQKQMAELERKSTEKDAQIAGLQEMFSKTPGTEAEPKIREKKNFEPKFRTVRIRQYPIAGDHENLGYVIGWTNRGAYQVVDRTGVSPQTVDKLDIIFLDHERDENGKLKAEQVGLLDLMNKGVQIHCKIVDKIVENKSVPTGEEIDISTYDPQHGLISTGEKIDGYVTYSDIKYKIQIPGRSEAVLVDSIYLN